MVADDVELEFISVMGVLVPMEATKGVSSEAKRFAAGDVFSDDEGTNHAEVSNDVGHTEIKCNKLEEDKTTNCPKLDDFKTRPEGKKKKKQKQEHKLEEGGEHTGSKKEVTTKMNIDPRTSVFEDKRLDQCESDSLEANITAKMATGDDSPVNVEYRMKSKKSRAARKRSSTSESNGDYGHTLNGETVKQEKTKPTQETPKSSKSRKRSVQAKAKAESESPVLERNPKKGISKTRKAKKSLGVQSKTDPEQPLTTQKEQQQQQTKRCRTTEKATTARPKHKRSRPTGGDANTNSSSMKQPKTAQSKVDKGQATNKLQTCDHNNPDRCSYPKCSQPTQSKSKCAKHSDRPRCSLPDCTKFAHSRGKCVRHGGGSRCAEENCGRRSRSQSKCYAHGGGMLCSHPTCTTRAKTKGKCVAHGGGTVCSEKECDKLVTANGKCTSHGGWVNCSHSGCEKRVQLRGKCMEHSESDVPVGDKPAKRFRKATIKPGEMNVPRKKHKGVDLEKSTAEETVNERAKEAVGEIEKTKTTTEQLDETTMALRSGQRIKLVTQNSASGYGELQSEEEALQMALKLSLIEF
ncbi:WRKY transcription factor 19 [Phytophthora nicotianae]|uniref:WRKY transcription factor 19 n=1 Tax=Phytophthora nicotianae TaxID=4792 RepID=A0A0W8CE58_PHYNI|nr:WRKY transcription factor 19 [Phytophthora nicotianae]